MKKSALLAAAAALAAASPAAAQGYLGVRYETGNLDAGFLGDQDYDGWQGEGAFGWDAPPGGWGGHFGGAFGNIETDTLDADFSRFDGHLYYEGAGGWRLGGVVATTSLDDADSDEWIYGLEGTFNAGPNVQWWGALTMGTLDDGTDEYDTWNADLGINFYSSPNVRFGGNIGFGNIDDIDYDTFSAGINGEFQPWSAPVSIYGGWQTFTLETTFLGDVESSAFSIGARWNFGGGTLQDRNNATVFTTNTQYSARLFNVGPN
jgi:hypothetical protein